MNSLVIYNLRDIISNLNVSQGYYEARIENTELKIPIFKVLEKINKSRVLYDRPQSGVDFNRVVNMIKSQQVTYLSAEDMIEHQDEFENWFMGDNIELAVTFILSLLSLISLIGTIMLCTHYCKSRTWTTAILASLMQHPETVKAASTTSDVDADMAFNEFRYRMYLLLAGIISYIIYRLMKEIGDTYYMVYAGKKGEEWQTGLAKVRKPWNLT